MDEIRELPTAEDRSPSQGIENSQNFRKIWLIAIGAALLIAWLLRTPPGLLGKTDAAAYAVCHRISSHSFYLGDRPFSLCARCSGQYLGFLWGFLWQIYRGKKRAGFPAGWRAILLAGFVIFFLIDGLNSFFSVNPGMEAWSLYTPGNQLRLFSGLGMGLAISGFYFPLLGQTLWKKLSPGQPISSCLDWAVFIGGAGLIGLLVIWENPLVSYFLILLSTAGLLILLTMLYTVIWILLRKRENSFSKVGELGWWIGAGLVTALFQIATLDAVRFLLTGSWSGFLDY